MYRTLVIVDDFYAEPLRLRQAALALDYPEVTGTRTFPGRTSAGPILPQGFNETVAALVGERPAPPASTSAFHGNFRVALAGETGRYHVHVDPSGLVWVGVIYLSLPQDCAGGAAVYRPWLWHSARPGFGDGLETARLIQLVVLRYPQ